MQVGTYIDGRKVNYDEATRQFDVEGSPVTKQDVVGYDRAGQIEWLSDDLRAWGHALASPESPTTTAEVVASPVAVPHAGKGLFGFRSRRVWKMLLASAYYLFAIVITAGLLLSRKPYATDGRDVAVEVLSGLLMALVLLSPAFLLSDFGYRDRLPLFKKRKVVWSALGLSLFLVLMLVTAGFASTLHTPPYKAAAAEEAAEQKAVAEAKRAADAERQAEEDAKAAEEARKAAEAEREAEEDAKAAEAEREAEDRKIAEAERRADEREAAEAAHKEEEQKAVREVAIQATEPGDAGYEMGDTVVVGKFEYVVNSTSVTKQLGTEPFALTTDGEYIIVNITVKNNDSKSRAMSTAMVDLLDSNGNRYSADSAASLYLDSGASFFENVNPGLTRTGDVAFEVPEGLSGLSAQVYSGVGFAAGKSEIVKLDR